MIESGDLCEIGNILKTHGINGELAATVDSRVDIDSLKCIILEIDGIFVPFFINNIRARGTEAVLVKIDGINDEKSAEELCGLSIYALKSQLNFDNADNEGFYVSDLIGFKILSDDQTELGVVGDFDDSTSNTLLIIKTPEGETRYIPLADELILDFDYENKILVLQLPKDILDI